MLISVNDSPSTPCTSTNTTVARPDLRAAGATFPKTCEILHHFTSGRMSDTANRNLEIQAASWI